MRYKLLTQYAGNTELAEQVNALLEEKWELYGSPFSGVTLAHGNYKAQAVILKEKEDL